MPAKPRTPQPADDLADLRQAFGGAEDDARTPVEPLNGPGPSGDTQEPPEGPGEPLASPQTREEQRALVIAAWHADTTAHGFVHRGGRCGCRYLADRALDAIAPVQVNEPTDDLDE